MYHVSSSSVSASRPAREADPTLVKVSSVEKSGDWALTMGTSPSSAATWPGLAPPGGGATHDGAPRVCW